MEFYNPHDWHWIVGGDESRYWSSAAGAYVEELPEGAGVTRIVSEAELTDVLAVYGLRGPVMRLEDYRAAIQSHVDATAQSRLYDSGTSLASYVASTNPAWAAEAQAFVAWRDLVWGHAYGELAKVEAQERDVPAVEDFLAELPVIEWPVPPS